MWSQTDLNTLNPRLHLPVVEVSVALTVASLILSCNLFISLESCRTFRTGK